MDEQLTIEHWREGELIGTFVLPVTRHDEGLTITMPYGFWATLAGGDELRIREKGHDGR